MDTGRPLFRAAAEAHLLCSPPRKQGARASSVLITQEMRKHKSSRRQQSVKRCSLASSNLTALHEAFLTVHPASIFFGLPWTKICWFIIFFGIWSSLKSMQTGHLSAHQPCAPFSVQFFPNCSQPVLFSTALRFVSNICLCISLHACLSKHPSDLFVKWYSIYCCSRHILHHNYISFPCPF